MWTSFLLGSIIAADFEGPPNELSKGDNLKRSFFDSLFDGRRRSCLVCELGEFSSYNGSIYDGVSLLGRYFRFLNRKRCKTSVEELKQLLKIFISESLYGSDVNIEPVMNFKDSENRVLLGTYMSLLGDPDLLEGLGKLTASNQYKLLHVIKTWGLRIRSAILNHYPDSIHSASVSEL
jgi:hypothetical protein